MLNRTIVRLLIFSLLLGGHSAAIRSYAAYLIEKVHVYGELQRDLVRTGVQGRDGYLRNLPLSKGLLHHVAALQKQIGALVSCKVSTRFYFAYFCVVPVPF
jgi:hypothetical protein